MTEPPLRWFFFVRNRIEVYFDILPALQRMLSNTQAIQDASFNHWVAAKLG